jgi:putative glutamine amidotransferase
MKLLAVTQRCVEVPCRETRDCLDQAWPRFLAECGFMAAPAPNEPDLLDAWLARLRPEAVLLTGGNAAPGTGQEHACPRRDAVERALITWAGSRGVPVLGVCRGGQMLNFFHGGRLRALSGHVAAQHALTPLPGAPAGLPKNANSFHDFGLLPEDLGAGLFALALAPDGSVELFVHASLRQAGLLWHPERFAPFRPEDLALVRNFLEVPS